MQIPLLLHQSKKTISETITAHNLKKPVIQLPKNLLPHSFDLVSDLRKLCPPEVEYYVLYDSMKKECCTDVIGARHVQYDGLFHIGYACFSQKIDPRCWYILPEIQWMGLEDLLKQKEFQQYVKDNQIKVILCDQGLYHQVNNIKKYLQEQLKLEVARLPFEKKQEDEYFGFGYYCSKNIQPRNVLVIKPDTTQPHSILQSCNPTSQLLLQNLYLSSKSLQIHNLHTVTPTSPPSPYHPSTNKKLLQRLSQISELPNNTTFGILVSNPSTKFCQKQIMRCRELLDRRGLKHFTFMMNNLNQCKLGNFPEIQVYVVVACYNYSLYSVKDFYRLVVAPYDLQVAFADASYENYQFDLNLQPQPLSVPKQEQEQTDQEKPKQKPVQNKITKINNELVVENMIQTLEFYKNREYKGLQFKQKKQVQKIKQGKIGIASQYTPLKQP